METITDIYPVDIAEKCKRVGCASFEEITILPENFANVESIEQFVYANEAKTLIKYFAVSKLRVSLLSRDKPVEGYQHTKAADVVLPAIFIPLKLLIENPALSAIIYNTISNYIWDAIRGFPGNKKVKVEIICQKSETTSNRLSFEGTAQSFKLAEHTIVSAIKELRKND